MTYPRAIEFLYGLNRFGLRPGLDATRRLAAVLGDPERSLRFLHVAGTNGKGSTCAFLEAVCRAAGMRTGLYTSPHLVSFRERIQVDGMPIPEAAVAELIGRWQPELAASPGGVAATFFECVTVLALEWFRRQGCDVVVWETGMGGRWDATNIVTPLVAAITNIGWDHMEWLGDSLGAIATEKAGIAKPGVPLVTTTEEPEALAAVRRVAEERGARLRVVGPADPELAIAASCRLPLAGAHQVVNAGLAVAMVKAAGAALRTDEAVIRSGLESARWPGRFQRVAWQGRTLILDGAHNPPAFRALEEAMRREYPGRRYGLVLGMLADKDGRSAAERLVPGASKTVVVPVRSSRGGDPAALVGCCRLVPGAVVEEAAGVKSALGQWAGGDPELVLITGSLYLVGEALELLGGGTTLSERGLNDWGRRM